MQCGAVSDSIFKGKRRDILFFQQTGKGKERGREESREEGEVGGGKERGWKGEGVMCLLGTVFCCFDD